METVKSFSFFPPGLLSEKATHVIEKYMNHVLNDALLLILVRVTI